MDYNFFNVEQGLNIYQLHALATMLRVVGSEKEDQVVGSEKEEQVVGPEKGPEKEQQEGPQQEAVLLKNLFYQLGAIHNISSVKYLFNKLNQFQQFDNEICVLLDEQFYYYMCRC